MVRGALVGSVTGAITALQLMELMVSGEPFSKVINSITNTFSSKYHASIDTPNLVI
ncbi:hypothetical protein LguiA_035626 [Lonicera macranthoides]